MGKRGQSFGHDITGKAGLLLTDILADTCVVVYCFPLKVALGPNKKGASLGGMRELITPYLTLNCLKFCV